MLLFSQIVRGLHDPAADKEQQWPGEWSETGRVSSVTSVTSVLLRHPGPHWKPQNNPQRQTRTNGIYICKISTLVAHENPQND